MESARLRGVIGCCAILVGRNPFGPRRRSDVDRTPDAVYCSRHCRA